MGHYQKPVEIDPLVMLMSLMRHPQV